MAFSFSTTYLLNEVCNELTEEAKENIEAYRYIWQPRGEKVHECLQEKMLGSGEIDVGRLFQRSMGYTILLEP